MSVTKFLCKYFSSKHDRVSLLSFMTYSILYMLIAAWVISGVIGSYLTIDIAINSINPNTLPLWYNICISVAIIGIIFNIFLVVVEAYEHDSDVKYAILISPVVSIVLYILILSIRATYRILTSITITECKREK